MTTTNILKIFEATDKVAQRCTRIAGTQHGSAWLADKLIRFFEKEKASEAITFEVFFNVPVMKAGEVTIHRDGSMEMRTI